MRFDGTLYELFGIGTGNIPYKEPEIADMDNSELSGAVDLSHVQARKNAERLKELEAELERRATSHPADQVDESLEKGVRFDDLSGIQKAKLLVANQHFDRSNAEARKKFFRQRKERAEEVQATMDLDEFLSTKDGHKKFVAALVAEQMDLIVTNGQGDFLGGKIVLDLPLSFEEYQAGAKKTAIYNQDARVLYPALGLPGEVGEVLEKATNLLMMAVHSGKLANQVKKIIRDDDCECDTPRKHDIGKEIGGVLWYCAAVASDLGLNLGDIAQENLDILASRQERGTIKGDGDER